MNKRWVTGITLSSTALVLAACGGDAGNEETAQAGEEGFPNGPVELVIPYPPGGGTDVLFRLVSSYAEEHLGENIVPTNIEGATATVGSRQVKDADPDGYTILGTHQVVAAAFHTDIVDYGFEAFDPVMMMTSTPHLPSVSREFSEENDVHNVQDLLAFIEENPNEMTWAFTTGSEDHYTITALLDAGGLEPDSLNFVNYDGTGPQYSALISGQVDGMTADYASGEGYFVDGDIVPLGVVSEEPEENLPEVETLQEQGIDFSVTVDRGVLAPEGTPEAHINVLEEAFEAALEDPELQERIEDLGSYPNFQPSEDYGAELDRLDSQMEELSEQMKFE